MKDQPTHDYCDNPITPPRPKYWEVAPTFVSIGEPVRLTINDRIRDPRDARYICGVCTCRHPFDAISVFTLSEEHHLPMALRGGPQVKKYTIGEANVAAKLEVLR